MDIEIISDVQNALLQRREVKFVVSQESSTVSKEQLKVELCRKLNTNPDSSIVEKISQRFGERRSDGVFYSYKDKASMERMEPKHLLKRYSKLSSTPAQEVKNEKGEKAEPALGENAEKGINAATEHKEGKHEPVKPQGANAKN
ncbi:MAG: hypothetical protein QXR58_00320 [Candidatus Micrarchaeaceae archaeon]